MKSERLPNSYAGRPRSGQNIASGICIARIKGGEVLPVGLTPDFVGL